MNLQWEKGRGVALASEIKEFEQDNGVKLPDQYKEHVLAYNGGYPSRTTFITSDGREGVFEALLNWDKNRKANIFFWKEIVKEKTLIPFGKDPFGNVICFKFTEAEEEPSIVFWDHELNKTSFISDNYNSFLKELK